MNILGLSCFYHDAAACLVREGKIIAAAQEERFNRKKNSADFPVNAVNFCLQAGNCTINDIDYVGFYEKPFLKFSRVVLGHLHAYPRSLPNFLRAMPLWLQDRLIMPLVIRRELGYEGKVLFVRHHLSHAASSFLASPFEDAALLTADSVGEWATMTCGSARGNDITIHKEMRFPDSLGLLYTAVTTYLGFEAHEGEGKVMGLAAYGKPKYRDDFYDMVKVNDDGSFRIDQRYFGFNTGNRMYSGKLIHRFGPPREPGSALDERHCDIAASLQQFTEEMLVRIARQLHRETSGSRLCLAGGVFLNCVANSRIMEETPYKELFIQPSAGDGGGAIGVALYIYHTLLGNPRRHVLTDTYLGPEYPGYQMQRALTAAGVPFKEMDDAVLFRTIAEKLAQNKIVGWFQGRMEFGPRALGNRSILANPCDPGMKDHLNIRVKNREPFRPFAPAALAERASEFFDFDGESPFMLLSPKVREEKKAALPAITHVDGTARLQTVTRETNPRFWQLISEFEQVTGIPVLLNTSFNLRGEPIVCAPRDAVNDFQKSQMDILVMGNCVAEKTEAPACSPCIMMSGIPS